MGLVLVEGKICIKIFSIINVELKFRVIILYIFSCWFLEELNYLIVGYFKVFVKSYF